MMTFLLPLTIITTEGRVLVGNVVAQIFVLYELGIAFSHLIF